MDNKPTTPDVAVITLIGQNQLNKLKQIPLPPTIDLTLTRIYFTNIRDGISRFLILFVQILWIGLIFFMGIELGKFIADLPQIPEIPIFKSAVLQSVTMFITIVFAFFILIMVLPVFLTKTIKGIFLTCLCYIIIGTFINTIIIAISFLVFYKSDNPYRLTVIIFAFITLILWWIVILNWSFSAKKRKKELIKSIIKMYELTYK